MNRISTIEFHEHPIFGNRKIDFTLPNGQPADTIILAGENGSGKTQLLEFLYKSLLTSSMPNISSITGQHVATIQIAPEKNNLTAQNSPITIDSIVLKVNENFAYSNITFLSKGSVVNQKIQYKPFSPIYSNVNINYNPRNAITGITTQTLDSELNLHNSNDDVAKESIQLLVDINSQDSQELSEWIDEHPTDIPPSTIKHRRLRRFTEAFNTIFRNKIELKTIKHNTTPIFSKDNKEIEIHQLSSGEKQIIFRGVQLLRNHELINGMPIFIDEPELSMHPKWEKGIYNYYQRICSNELEQTSQLFMATHSEHLLESALLDNRCIIIKLSQSEDLIQKFCKDSVDQILPTATLAEIKYSIFNIYTIDFYIALYGFLQNSTNFTSISKIDNWLKKQGATRKGSEFTNAKGETIKYETLPTLIRNHIDHPDNAYNYTEEEFKKSTDFLVEKVKELRLKKTLK